MTDSHVYFIADDEELLREESAMALQARGLPMHCKRRRLPTREILGPAMLGRLEEFEEQWHQYRLKRLQEGSPVPSDTYFFASLSQHASHFNKHAAVLPPLIQNSIVWSEKLGRIMTGREHLGVQGWPVYQAHGLAYECCPLKTLMNPELD